MTTQNPITTQVPHPLAAAKFFLACGYSVVPVLLDGTKKAAISWEPYRDDRVSLPNLERWFCSGNRGIALIQGAVSGKEPGECAEMLEFETPEIFERWLRAMEHRGHADLAEALSLRVRSGGGGIHVYYRHTDEVQGNQKLARSQTAIPGHKQGSDGMTTLIETRGQGGYVVAPGSPAAVHETGNLYQILSGSFRSVPTLTPEERQAVFAVCREFDERPPAPVRAPRPVSPIPVTSTEGRPGDDFNERGAAEALACLERHGWSVERDHGDWQEMRRPGKTRGSSASFGHVAPGVLHVFSSNAGEFEMDSTTGPFEIVTRLDFGGDYKASARHLASRGYGTPLPPRSTCALATKPANRYHEPKDAKERPSQEDMEAYLLVRARMMALLRICQLGMTQWPEWTLAEPDPQSEEAGEAVVLVGDTEISVSRELLRRSRVMELADLVQVLEAETEGEGKVEAWALLFQLDHFLTHSGIWSEHSECVEHYTRHTLAQYEGQLAKLSPRGTNQSAAE